MTVVYEIENMNTKNRFCVEAVTHSDMEAVLLEKGFVSMWNIDVVGEDNCFVGHNSEGDEIGAQPATFNNVRLIKPLSDIFIKQEK